MDPGWRSSFAIFWAWAQENGYNKGLCIERKDNDAGYTPENCIFATRLEQSRNRRTTFGVAAFGESKPLTAWIEDPRCVVGYSTLYRRLKQGMDPEAAMTVDPQTPWTFRNQV